MWNQESRNDGQLSWLLFQANEHVENSVPPPTRSTVPGVTLSVAPRRDILPGVPIKQRWSLHAHIFLHIFFTFYWSAHNPTPCLCAIVAMWRVVYTVHTVVYPEETHIPISCYFLIAPSILNSTFLSQICFQLFWLLPNCPNAQAPHSMGSLRSSSRHSSSRRETTAGLKTPGEINNLETPPM